MLNWIDNLIWIKNTKKKLQWQIITIILIDTVISIIKIAIIIIKKYWKFKYLLMKVHQWLLLILIISLKEIVYPIIPLIILV